MVPADADDVSKEFELLLNELINFNPELADKQRVLAITKCDMLDEELMAEMEQMLPVGVPHVFISSITGLGIQKLKDLLWSELQKEIPVSNDTLVHRPKEITYLQQEMEEEGEDEDITPTTIFMDEEEDDWHDFYDEDEEAN